MRGNVWAFVVLNALLYLGAPVLYVDVVHASLCNQLGATKLVANLPTAVAAITGFIPLFVAWAFPRSRQIKPVLVTSHLLAAAIGLGLSLVLWLPLPAAVQLTLTILHGGLTTALMLTISVYLWEAVMRGTGEAVRGWMFGLTFGLGPLFAVASSLAVQWALETLPDPWNFSLLFAGSAVLMLAAAAVAARFQLSGDESAATRESLRVYLFGGLRSFFSSRILVLVTLATLLTQTGFFVMNNASLEVKSVLGREPEELSGWISALRFGVKGLAGVGLGMLLARGGPRPPAVATMIALIAAIVWTMTIPGYAYLFAFGLFGAAELYGVYFPYSVAAASPTDRVTRNAALYGVLGNLGYLTAAGHGALADRYGAAASLGVALTAAIAALLCVMFLPPAPLRVK